MSTQRFVHNHSKPQTGNNPYFYQQENGFLKLWYIHAMEGNCMAVQWLRLRAFTAEGLGSIPGWGTKIPQAMWCGQKNKTKHIPR